MSQQRKIYLIPETAFELFLEPRTRIMGESQFGHNDGVPGPFGAPSRKLYL